MASKASFLSRFYIYQKERFPFIAHGLLIAAFSFSAISYSRICRGYDSFIPLPLFLLAVFTTVTLFFLVRVFDEFKDAEDDAKYRQELPVPRGLISLKELAIAGAVMAIVQIVLNLLFAPVMLLLYFAVIAYLLLMGKEFFVAEWLKKHQVMYIISHMFIIPLVDIYASGFDWLLQGNGDAPKGLLFFFAVSYMNGVVLEFGRKIRVPEAEKHGVLTYSSLYGPVRAVVYWLICLFITFMLSVAAAYYAGYGTTGVIILSVIFLLCALPGAIFIKNMSAKMSKAIEIFSGIWTFAMYLTLGGIPMVDKIFFQ